MPKIPGICREYFFDYYAESNAGTIGLTLSGIGLLPIRANTVRLDTVKLVVSIPP